jgi:hypothetical protein
LRLAFPSISCGIFGFSAHFGRRSSFTNTFDLSGLRHRRLYQFPISFSSIISAAAISSADFRGCLTIDGGLASQSNYDLIGQ